MRMIEITLSSVKKGKYAWLIRSEGSEYIGDWACFDRTFCEAENPKPTLTETLKLSLVKYEAWKEGSE